MPELPPEPISPLLRTRRDLLRQGLTDDDISRRHRAGSFVRLRPGSYADAESWGAAYVEAQTIADAVAYLTASRGVPPVFSHQTAAAIHGLPLFRCRRGPVHVTIDGAARTTPATVRHRMPLPPGDVVWLPDGAYGVTTMSRTVFDLCAGSRAETAVAAADAALRMHATRAGSRTVDPDAAEEFREELRRRASTATGRRGIRLARFVTEFADARAESTGESVSRLYLHQLGFPPPGLQVPVPGPAGTLYEVDFDLHTAWGEFDGAAKYTDARFLRGRTPAQALADEKLREDWIRGTTTKPFARWGSAHIPDAATFGRHLAAFGIHPPRANAHLLRQ